MTVLIWGVVRCLNTFCAGAALLIIITSHSNVILVAPYWQYYIQVSPVELHFIIVFLALTMWGHAGLIGKAAAFFGKAGQL